MRALVRRSDDEEAVAVGDVLCWLLALAVAGAFSSSSVSSFMRADEECRSSHSLPSSLKTLTSSDEARSSALDAELCGMTERREAD